jgi:hypothetical protein
MISCFVKKNVLFAWRSVARCFGDWLLGRDKDFDWFGLFCDSSRWFGEGVDEGAALFIDPELDSPGWRAHDVQ